MHLGIWRLLYWFDQTLFGIKFLIIYIKFRFLLGCMIEIFLEKFQSVAMELEGWFFYIILFVHRNSILAPSTNRTSFWGCIFHPSPGSPWMTFSSQIQPNTNSCWSGRRSGHTTSGMLFWQCQNAHKWRAGHKIVSAVLGILEYWLKQ